MIQGITPCSSVLSYSASGAQLPLLSRMGSASAKPRSTWHTYRNFLRENRRQYLTYKMLGATGGKIAGILLAELAVYTLAAFAISCAGALPFIKHSGLILRYMPFRAVDFILLFAALYCFAALASLGQVRALAGRSVRAGRADTGPDRDRAAQTKDEPGAGKGLYLLSFLYRKNIWRTVSIVFLSLATAFTLAYAMTYVYDAGKMERYINRVFPNDMYSVHLNNSTVSTINTDAFERQINPLEHPLNQELEARLAQLGVPVGRLRFRMLTQKDAVDENSELKGVQRDDIDQPRKHGRGVEQRPADLVDARNLHKLRHIGKFRDSNLL